MSLRTSLLCFAALAAGCGSNLCDRTERADPAKKAGDCGGAGGKLLGDRAACSSRQSACTAADQSALTRAFDCLDKLPVCSASTKATWASSHGACLSPLSAEVSQACRQAFFAAGIPGLEGSAPDAGLWSVNDGGHGVDLVGVADETSVAFAWAPRQPGAVTTWVLSGVDSEGRREDTLLSPGTTTAFLVSDGGAPRRWFVAGLDGQGALVWGSLDAASDGGLAEDAGLPERPLPFLSPEVPLALGARGASATIPVGSFGGRNADIAALDSARVIAVMQQDGRIVAHVSRARGADFPSDAVSSSSVDSTGSYPRVTWNPDSRVVYVCYTVGRGVRVRRSTDEGRSWSASAASLESPEDAGATGGIASCDIAPWKNGGALMVTVDGDALVVRTVSSDLALGPPEYAMRSSLPAANNVMAPAHPAIATLPADELVHVTFTGTRQLASLALDTEIYGVYRDATTNGFGSPKFLKPGFGATLPGTNSGQDWSTVAIDPKTKRAVAAYTSLEVGPSGSELSTVYVALWSDTARLWGTGSDLNVFVLDSRDNATSLLFPSKQKNDLWDAFSPGVAALPSGKLVLTFVAGPRLGAYGDYRFRMVGFDFSAKSPVSNGDGWFVLPVKALSATRVLSPSGVGSAPGMTVSAATADTQLSIHAVFAEGLGANGEVDARTLYVTSP